MLYCLVHPFRFLSIFPSNWAYINNNKNAIYALYNWHWIEYSMLYISFFHRTSVLVLSGVRGQISGPSPAYEGRALMGAKPKVWHLVLHFSGDICITLNNKPPNYLIVVNLSTWFQGRNILKKYEHFVKKFKHFGFNCLSAYKCLQK